MCIRDRNCLVERTIDARMVRTSWRATARGDISVLETFTLAILLGASGLWLLHAFINDLTLWLTLGTFVGYTVVYTPVSYTHLVRSFIFG